MLLNVASTLEQLEVCVELIKTNSATRHLMALTYLDSIIDSSWYSLFSEKLEPKYSPFIVIRNKKDTSRKEWKPVLRFFNEKITKIKKDKKLNGEHLELLKLIHIIRNGTIHHGSFYLPCAKEIVSVLFNVVCVSLETIISEQLNSFKKPQDESKLSEYNFKCNYLDEKNIHKILVAFQEETKISDKQIKDKFFEDINKRMEHIDNNIKSFSTDIVKVDWNYYFKQKEFEILKEEELEDLKEEYCYSGMSDYFQKKEAYDKEEEKMFSTFSPTITLNTLPRIKKQMELLSSKASRYELSIWYLSENRRLNRMSKIVSLICEEKYDEFMKQSIYEEYFFNNQKVINNGVVK